MKCKVLGWGVWGNATYPNGKQSTTPYQMFSTPARFVDNNLCFNSVKHPRTFSKDDLCFGNAQDKVCSIV